MRKDSRVGTRSWGRVESFRAVEPENERELAKPACELPHTGKSCSEVVARYFIWMLTDSEIVP